jgi:hypothetical protein
LGVSPSLALLLLSVAAPADRFREANDAARSGDLPKALAGYSAVAAAGQESASLYWNWAQAASARGAFGEALWALLRARELDPGDAAVGRQIEELRKAANLDPAELQPEPLQALGRFSRRFQLAPLAMALCLLSLLLHVAARLTARDALVRAAVAPFVLACLAASLPLAAALARPTAVVARRGAPLLEAASPNAEPVATLREGEVVPILEASAGFLRIEDRSGARGWARLSDVRRLDGPPPAD